MPTAHDLRPWRAELKEIIDLCTQRASLPMTLPHCAICARYATDNLPFEALMSVLDVMPEELRPEALAAAQDRLSALAPAMRQQQVNAVTLPVLMASPGWCLVRSLVIDMANQEVHQCFNDPRLSEIEEITLLGFAYGGCEMQQSFIEALANSRGFSNVRSLILHSIESDKDLARRFWASPFVCRLERIEGVPYYGDPVAGPLAVRELKVAGYGDLADGFSLSALLDLGTSPHLTTLSLSAYHEGLAPLLDVIGRERKLLERIESVSLRLSDFGGKWAHVLGPATLPASAKNVSLYSSSLHHVSLIHLRGGCDINTLYDFAEEPFDLRFNDKVTEYSNLVFDWNLRDQVSRRVVDLALLLPLEIDIAQVLQFCNQLRDLKKLTLIYPFSEAELETLLASERICRLEALSLFLNFDGGQWDMKRPNEYMKANVSRYQSRLPSKWLFDLVFDEGTASIHNLSLFTRSFDLTRSPNRIQHCDIHDEDAAYALAACDPRLPIEVLNFDYHVRVDENVAKALAGTGVLGRVYRLSFNAHLDAAGARVLASYGHLENLRDLKFFDNRNAADAVRTFLCSPHLTGVWDLDLSLSGKDSADLFYSDARVFERVVALELRGPDRSPRVPLSGRLTRVRRIAEGLNMSIFGDGRLAAIWGNSPLGLPLRARINDFVERKYRVDYKQEDLPDLQKKLLTFEPFHDENGFEQALRAVLATAFTGKPVPENTSFAALTDKQQSALTAIARVKGDWWNIGGLMNGLMTSYGFGFWDQESLNKYIAGMKKASD
jgi:hypothetical protein